MAIGDLNPAVWRIDVYTITPATPFSGVITDLSNLYTSDLTITKQRNYPDEVTFTLDLQQLEERAKNLNLKSRDILQPYKHHVRCYRNNKFMAQGIVVKTTANLNNQGKNTIEVQCVDTLGLLEKRLIHQDYGEGSWADFAKEVVKDAQHEPNRIYNYAFEGDGVGTDNAWFRGWKYLPGEDTLSDFPEWEPNHLYSMYDTCTHDAKFWEAKEHAFYSGETFSESNWTLLGILNEETGEVEAAYGVWREDEEKPGPTGTALGGWGGTSSCHMTARTFSVTNGTANAISMKDSTISSTLVASYDEDSGAPRLPVAYQEVEYLESHAGIASSTELGPYIDTGVNLKKYNSRLKITTDVLVTAYNSGGNTLYGAAYGLKDGTWYWNPQFKLSVVTDNRPRVEYPITGNTGTDTTGQIVCNNKTVAGTRQTIVLDALGQIPTLTIGGATYNGDTDLGDSSQYGPDCNLFVFALNYVNPENIVRYRRASYATPMRLYSMTIESKNSVLRQYVPCYTRDDQTPGLYDMQHGKFYPVNTPGYSQMTYGPEVVYPSEEETQVLTLTAGNPEHRDVAKIDHVDADTLANMFAQHYQNILDQGIYPTGITFTGEVGGSCSCFLTLSEVPEEMSVPQIYIWEGDDTEQANEALAFWGIILKTEES